jgi:diguanylate cyclase
VSIDPNVRAHAASTPHAVFVDRLLSLIHAVAPEAEERETRTFLGELERYRQVSSDPSRLTDVPRVTEACIAACQRYFKLSRKYRDDRNTEYTEIIKILRDAAKVSVGNSNAFNAQVLASSERFGRLTHIDDVRVLREQLVREVSDLRHAAQEKQQRDEQAYAQLTSRVEALQAQLEMAEAEASRDGLTGVANRAQFNRVFAQYVAQAREKDMPLALAMLDVDNFKQINDTHGHPVGDRVLVCAAKWLLDSLRKTDFVARYGGEEFAVLLPYATAAQTEDRLVRLLQQVADSCYEYDLLGKKERVRFTLSCGLADLQADESAEDLLQRTDQALYEAKKTGKNKVVCRKRKSLKSLFGMG